jgi:hypothetical protein
MTIGKQALGMTWRPVLAIFAATVALGGCAATPPASPAGGSPPPRTAKCTDPGGWAAWTGGITASGSTAFCGYRSRP